MSHEVADALDRQIGRTIGGDRFRIVSVLPLAGEDRGDALAPVRGHDAAAIEASVRGVSRAPDRAEACVKSRRDWTADADSISSVLRQRQLPSALPGWFMRASLPRLRTSCNGAIASAATDDHARRNKTGATSSLLPVARSR